VEKGYIIAHSYDIACMFSKKKIGCFNIWGTQHGSSLKSLQKHHLKSLFLSVSVIGHRDTRHEFNWERERWSTV